LIARAGLFALALALAPTAQAAERVDLELVLAVDASGSVDDREFALQLGGDAAIHDAIAAGALGRIAVSLVIWADATVPRYASPWRILDGVEAARGFAAFVGGQTRRARGGTGIGAALAFSTQRILRNGIAGTRLVIDVSGDGYETTPRDYVVLLWQGRSVADRHGVTVNGLAILSDAANLAEYYRQEVITGPGAFVMTAAGFDDFAGAMRRKLLREIEDKPRIGLLR
jgi:hypothetical protein